MRVSKRERESVCVTVRAGCVRECVIVCECVCECLIVNDCDMVIAVLLLLLPYLRLLLPCSSWLCFS